MSASLLSQSARGALAGLVALGWSAAPAAAQDVKIGAIMSTTGHASPPKETGPRGPVPECFDDVAPAQLPFSAYWPSAHSYIT